MKTIKQKQYIIQDREAGNLIDTFDSMEMAEKALESYERDDRRDGVYVENFYEIVESED